ncbi:hypothetical protein ACH495_31055 [Micromonospora sp. NPDC018662]|uniref:hypothetical protein n=1 Tax=Micromonospora sp. NPDC018662 TaxID=3364238 RepID=UPI00379D944E
MRALVEEYGGVLPSVDVGALLEWLDAFSDRHWNFRKRGNVERDQVTAPTFEPGRAALVLAAATALRLVEPADPPRATYDHLLVLGGLGRACLQRTEYAARLVRDGVVSVGAVAALGSYRPLTEAETTLPGLADSRFEMDAMDVGVRDAFGLAEPAVCESSDEIGTHRSWQVRTYRADGCPPVQVLAAPSSEPEQRRANTPDTYDFWTRRSSLRPTDRILVVTSPIYVPFQHSDAIRMLAARYGCGIDTIGFDPARSTVPPADGAANPDRYLQEIRSGILSMQRLHQALAGSLAA